MAAKHATVLGANDGDLAEEKVAGVRVVDGREAIADQPSDRRPPSTVRVPSRILGA